jgi:hypothetical protein
MAGWLGDGAARSDLEHAKLRLQRRHVSAEGLEGLLDLYAIETVARARDVLEPRERRQRRPSLGSPWILSRHLLYASTLPCTGVAESMTSSSAGRAGGL